MSYPSIESLDSAKLTSVAANLPGDSAKIVAAILANRTLLNSTSETVQSNSSSIITLGADIQAVNTNLEGYKITVASALNLDQDQLDLLQSAIDNLQSGDIASLLTNIATAQSDISTLTADLGTANSRAEALAGQVNSLTSAFNTLLTTLQGEAGVVDATTFA